MRNHAFLHGDMIEALRKQKRFIFFIFTSKGTICTCAAAQLAEHAGDRGPIPDRERPKSLKRVVTSTTPLSKAQTGVSVTLLWRLP